MRNPLSTILATNNSNFRAHSPSHFPSSRFTRRSNTTGPLHIAPTSSPRHTLARAPRGWNDVTCVVFFLVQSYFASLCEEELGVAVADVFDEVCISWVSDGRLVWGYELGDRGGLPRGTRNIAPVTNVVSCMYFEIHSALNDIEHLTASQANNLS
jgi:hypothetical protein